MASIPLRTFAAGVLACAVAAPASAQNIQFRLGTIFAPGVPLVACGGIPMAEDADGTLSDAGLSMTTIHSAQLGNETQLAEQIASGELEVAHITSSILAAWVENLAVLETYYLYDNVDQAMAVYDTETAKQMLDELREVANIRVIGRPWLYGVRNVFGSKPTREPADFEGVRMRVPETFVSIEGAQSLGAQATPVAYPELYLALQQGIVELAEAPLAVIAAESFDEPAEYVTLTKHLITAQPFVVNEAFWQELSPEQQEALTTTVNAASDRIVACAEKADAEAVAAWKESGELEVVEDFNREAIAEKSRAYWSEGFPFSETYVKIREELQ